MRERGEKGLSRVSTNQGGHRGVEAAGAVQAAPGLLLWQRFGASPKPPWFPAWSPRMDWVGRALLKIFSSKPCTEQGHLHCIRVRSLGKGGDEQREVKYLGCSFGNCHKPPDKPDKTCKAQLCAGSEPFPGLTSPRVLLLEGVLDPGPADHREELLQAARARGPAVRLRGPADPADHHHAQHRPPGALPDRGTDLQQPRWHRVPHPGERNPPGCSISSTACPRELL